MAFRHGEHGTLTARTAVWVCPTCNAQNTNRLEEGCPACKAGKDAVAAVTEAWIHPDDAPAPSAGFDMQGFDVWWHGHQAEAMEMSLREVAEWAWNSARLIRQAEPVGVAQATVPAAAAPARTGGYTMALVSPDAHEPTRTDQRTHDTVLAALAFYRDNQLAYGAVPGQLSAQECTALITKLTPEEPEVPQ